MCRAGHAAPALEDPARRNTMAGMFSPDQYALLDFGRGRRLERLARVVLDRPCPAVEGLPVSDPALWKTADARFERRGPRDGQWVLARALPDRWTVAHGRAVFELKRTDFGHLGLFPEQAVNWDWIAERAARGSRPMRILNLFAYTGGSTLAAADASAEVTHVDAAGNIVEWARRNARLSGLEDARVRWICEDALKFVKRELRRGAEYEAVILDPPSYGHGRRGEVWRLGRDLPRLLRYCGELTAGRRRFLLLTAHTPGFGPKRLANMVTEALDDAASGELRAGELEVPSIAGRCLPSGSIVTWQRSTP